MGAPDKRGLGRGSTVALRPAAVGLRLSRSLCRVLAAARQRFLGWRVRGGGVPAASRRVAAQGMVSHDRHPGGRGRDRGADGVFPAKPHRFSRRSGALVRACALVTTLLRNFASYAAALAGGTAAIIASDELGAIGGVNGEAFTLAVTRVSEIWIGIVCAGIVLAGTDFGGAPRRLAALLGPLSAQIASVFGSALKPTGSALSEMQPVRRELIRQVIALDPAIDQAIGESSRLHYHSRALQAAKGGLFEALAGWSAVVWRLAETVPSSIEPRYAMSCRFPERQSFSAASG
jgi:Fusaric acid resistance protein family